MYERTHLGWQTDSAQWITLETEGDFIVPTIAGVAEGYRTLSHHRQNPKKIEQLASIEIEHRKARLQPSKEEGETLLDRSLCSTAEPSAPTAAEQRAAASGWQLG